MSVQVFVSCLTKHNWARDKLIAELSAICPSIELVYLHVKEASDSSWKTSCRNIMERTIGTIVLIGRSTHLSEGVRWEIEETKRQNKRILGISLDGEAAPHVSLEIRHTDVVTWSNETLATRLETWIH